MGAALKKQNKTKQNKKVKMLNKDKMFSFWHNDFFFFFGHTLSIWTFPGQGLNPSQSCKLHHSCSNTRSLTHCAGLGIKPMPPQRQARSLTHCATAGTLKLNILMCTNWWLNRYKHPWYHHHNQGTRHIYQFPKLLEFLFVVAVAVFDLIFKVTYSLKFLHAKF